MNCSKSLEYEECGCHLEDVEHIHLGDDYHGVLQVDVLRSSLLFMEIFRKQKNIIIRDA